jgi:hypothetical protein
MAQDETTKGRVPLTATRGISVFGISVNAATPNPVTVSIRRAFPWTEFTAAGATWR